MKIPFVGPSYAAASTAAAAQECMNLFVEMIEDPNERSKAVAYLRGAPGKHLFSAQAANTRGLWSGGGRLFIANGLDLIELDEDGLPVSTSTYTATDDGFPVQMFGNGNQLLIISAGQAYIDNGTGPVACRFLLNGTVTAVGTAIGWVSGDKFTADMVGRAITINGHELLVATYVSNIAITTSTGLGTGAGTVSTFFNFVYWQTGDVFTDAIVGLPITINGVVYTVKEVESQYTLNITGDAGQQSGVAYSTVLTNLSYSCAGGDLVTAETGAYLDGYFLVQRPRGGTPDLGRQINFSAIGDGTSWSGLDFKDKEGWPDYIRGILVDSELLYVFGDETMEVWQTVANVNSSDVFQRLPGAMEKFGSASPWGCAAIRGKTYFMGSGESGKLVAYRIDGGSVPTRISTHAEEAAWGATGVGPIGVNCVSYTYEEEGHVFWVTNFGSQCWAWDETSKTWAQRSEWSGSAFTGSDTSYHTFIQEWGNGKHITCGSILDGNIYESSVNFYDSNGADMAWRRAIPYRYNDGKRIYFGRMDLEMETGTVPSGAAPTITRDYSDDRGRTFINPQTAAIGVHNDSALRVFWPVGGSSPGRVWRFFGSGQYKVALVDLNSEDTMGTV